MTADLTNLRWRKSSYSVPMANQECVEMADVPDGGVALRHSQQPGGAILLYTAGEWDAFVKGAKAGEFDRT